MEEALGLSLRHVGSNFRSFHSPEPNLSVDIFAEPSWWLSLWYHRLPHEECFMSWWACLGYCFRSCSMASRYWVRDLHTGDLLGVRKTIGQEKLECIALQTGVLTNLLRSAGPETTIRSCSEFRQRDQAHIDQVLDAVYLWEGGVSLEEAASLAQGHNLERDSAVPSSAKTLSRWGNELLERSGRLSAELATDPVTVFIFIFCFCIVFWF